MLLALVSLADFYAPLCNLDALLFLAVVVYLSAILRLVAGGPSYGSNMISLDEALCLISEIRWIAV